MARRKGLRMKLEIERLRGLGHGKKTISRILKISRNTVRRYWDEEVKKQENASVLYVAPWADALDWKIIEEAVSRGQTLLDYWESYQSELQDEHVFKAIAYVTFWREYRRRYPRVDLVMHKNYQPGLRAEADYKGREPDFGFIDKKTGEWIQLELFGAALCFSQLFYCEATYTQKQVDWLIATQGAFRYFGGVTETVGIDNATVSIKRADFYDPDVNFEYWKFSKYFDFAPVPTEPGKPTHKAVIENLLGVFWRWMRARFKIRTFFSKAEVNHFLFAMCNEFNNRVQKKYGSSRRERFENAEKGRLKPIPKEVYEIAEWQKAKLHVDCHVQVKWNFYSCPYHLRGKELDVRVSPSFIEVFNNLERISLHRKFSDGSKGRYQTDRNHLPPAHQAMLEYTPQNVLDDAKKIGPETFFVVERLITKSRHPLVFLRRCQGIVRLKSKLGAENVERASKVINGLEIKFPRFNELQSIAKAPVQPLAKKVIRKENPYLRGQGSWSINPKEENNDNTQH
ncbi:MAG: IS21 family transposase [Deltaproteobacteria bacterium]|nr:IS21 family transposase [Deltaproteobacteria bacterium]